MRTASILLMLFATLATAVFNFSGSSSYFYKSSTGDNPWSELPVEFWRWRCNPILTIAGIPVVADIYISSEENQQKQNMNRVYISSSPSASSRRGSRLSWISSIGVGASNPCFSDFTLNAAYISGINLAINPGKFYFAAAGGRNRRAVEPDSINHGAYERNLYGMKTGFGSPSGNHLHLGILYGKDIDTSIEQDSTFRITPAENWVTSLHCGTVAFDDKFRIGGEIAGSMFTRDRSSPEIDDDDVPQWLLDFSGANVSSALGWASNLSSSLRIAEFMLYTSLKRVGTGFESMGAPYLRNDEISFEARAEKYFINRHISTGIWYRKKVDNLLETKNSTCYINSYGVRTGFFFRSFPSIYLSFSPSFTQTLGSSATEVETSHISVSTSYKTFIAGLGLNSSAAFSVHDNYADNGYSDYSSTSIVLRETLSLKYPLVFTGCVSAIRTRTGSYPSWRYTGDLRTTWYSSSSLSLTCGTNYAFGDTDKKTGILLNGGFPITDRLMTNVSGEYTKFSSETEKDYTNASAGSGITVTW